MKIIYSNRKQGVIKLRIENLDDLWYLSCVIRPNDIVESITERRIKAKEDIARVGKSERIPVRVKIRVEKADFRSDRDTFRISGRIVEGPEDIVAIGSYHTINVEKDTTIAIIKDKWSKIDIDRLRDAQRSAIRPKILIAVIDDGDANFGVLRESKIQYYSISKNIGGKYEIRGRKERRLEFYRDSAEFISNILQKENISAIILAGAGFEKENFHKFLLRSYPVLAKKVVIEHIGSHGRAGISEVLRREKVKKVIEGINSALEVRMVDELLREIGRDSGLGVYSLRDVENAANTGAVRTLLICDDLFLRERKRIEEIISIVRSANGDIHLINHEGEAGQQLSSLGGIAGILRFRIH